MSVEISQKAYEVLRKALQDGTIGPGQQFTATEVSKVLRISSTPILYALKRLAAENLVQSRARSGFTAKGLNQTELLWLFQHGHGLLRNALTISNSRQENGNVLDTVPTSMMFLDHIVDDNVDTEQLVHAFNEFYLWIAGLSANRVIVEATQHYVSRTHIYRFDSLSRADLRGDLISTLQRVSLLLKSEGQSGLHQVVDTLFHLKYDNMDKIWRSSAYRMAQPGDLNNLLALSAD